MFEWVESISHLEYLVRYFWLERQKNVPSRGDYYTMALTGVVKSMFSNKSTFDLTDQIIEFLTADEVQAREAAKKLEQSISPEQFLAISRLGIATRLQEAYVAREQERILNADDEEPVNED